GFARALGRHDSGFRTRELRDIAYRRGQDRPLALVGALDWRKVHERRLTMLAAQETTPEGLPYRYNPAAVARAAAWDEWLGGDLEAALAEWRKQPAAPSDSL